MTNLVEAARRGEGQEDVPRPRRVHAGL